MEDDNKTSQEANTQKVEITKEEFDKLSALPTVVNNLVEELKLERKAKQDAITAAAIAPVIPADAPAASVEETVRKLLAEQAAGTVKEERSSAEATFRNTHKEFHPDNDPGGLKWAAFEKSLAEVNLSGASSKDAFVSKFETALLIMNKGKSSSDATVITPYADTPVDSGGNPIVVNSNGLTAKELRIVKNLGWTEERYVKLKKSNPAYVESIIQQAK